MLKLAITTDLHSATYQQSLALRRAVFITEQGVAPEIEIADEAGCVYFLLSDDNQPVATARLKTNATTGKIQRVAVAKNARGRGLGQQIMHAIEQWASENGLRTLRLGAQQQAITFYQKIGFNLIGSPYIEANIPHQDMEKTI